MYVDTIYFSRPIRLIDILRISPHVSNKFDNFIETKSISIFLDKYHNLINFIINLKVSRKSMKFSARYLLTNDLINLSYWDVSVWQGTFDIISFSNQN